MRFDKFLPTDKLKAYIQYFVVSEQQQEHVYKVLPSTSLVMGFQYSGHLATIDGEQETGLATAGITGITDRFRMFKNTACTGTILVYFTETGFSHFVSCPAHELFNQSISLQAIFDKNNLYDAQEQLSLAQTDRQRIHIIEQLLLSQLKPIQPDQLIAEAIRLIHISKGTTRIKDLHQQLYISQSPFEKRFRKWVGTTPKKFASIVRFQSVLKALSNARFLTDICYENLFFDQAHFNKDFKRYTGDTPENFRHLRETNDFLQ